MVRNFQAISNLFLSLQRVWGNGAYYINGNLKWENMNQNKCVVIGGTFQWSIEDRPLELWPWWKLWRPWIILVHVCVWPPRSQSAPAKISNWDRRHLAEARMARRLHPWRIRLFLQSNWGKISRSWQGQLPCPRQDNMHEWLLQWRLSQFISDYGRRDWVLGQYITHFSS